MSSDKALLFKQSAVLDLKDPAASVPVKHIPLERYGTISDVCRAAETTARGCIPTCIIHGGAGSGTHWPFFESVLTDDTLALIRFGLLSPQKVDELRTDFGEDDNSSFSPSPKESKVAKALGRPQPSSAAEGANLKPLFEEAAASEEVEGGGEERPKSLPPPNASPHRAHMLARRWRPLPRRKPQTNKWWTRLSLASWSRYCAGYKSSSQRCSFAAPPRPSLGERDLN